MVWLFFDEEISLEFFVSCFWLLVYIKLELDILMGSRVEKAWF